jgi:hypothetical protein
LAGERPDDERGVFRRLDGHGAQADAVRRPAAGGPAVTLEAAKDLAHELCGFGLEEAISAR